MKELNIYKHRKQWKFSLDKFLWSKDNMEVYKTVTNPDELLTEIRNLYREYYTTEIVRGTYSRTYKKSLVQTYTISLAKNDFNTFAKEKHLENN